MIEYVFVYWLFVTLTLWVAWRAARDWASRLFLAAVFAAALASFGSQLALSGAVARFAVDAIDLSLFVFATLFALKRIEGWALWFAGLQGAAMLTMAAEALAGADQQWIFAMIRAFWAIPSLLVLAFGMRAFSLRHSPDRGADARFV
ncbi:MAG: hypothetical protein ACEQR8_03485 [Cypionkella sp.]